MRLQLIPTAAAVVLLASGLGTSARADNRVGSWLSVYADNDNLTVVSPQLSGRVDVHDQVEMSMAFDVDVISAATVDVVSAASPRGYDERRQGGSVGASWAPDARTVGGLSYLMSSERDYRSHGVAVSGSREWVDRRLTTRLDARMLFDRVGRSGDDASLWHDLRTTAGAATVAWIFDRNTIGDLAYELQYVDGFQSSPYRYVFVEWDGAMAPGVSVAEAVPGTRVRHAVAVRARRALGDRWFGSLQYRLYFDDWGVVSHTGEVEAQRAFAWDRLIVGVTARAYRQSAADFHLQTYSQAPGTLPQFRSGDKMLADSWSVLGGLRAEMSYEPGVLVNAIRAVAKVELYQQHFSTFAPLRSRRATITSLGAVAEF